MVVAAERVFVAWFVAVGRTRMSLNSLFALRVALVEGRCECSLCVQCLAFVELFEVRTGLHLTITNVVILLLLALHPRTSDVLCFMVPY